MNVTSPKPHRCTAVGGRIWLQQPVIAQVPRSVQAVSKTQGAPSHHMTQYYAS